MKWCWRFILISFLFLQFAAVAQPAISGILKNPKGAVIPYASIAYRGTRVGAVSGADGGFTIQKRVGDTLRFSALGYKSVEFHVVDSTTFIQLQLPFSTRQLPQVEVGADYKRKISFGHLSQQNNYWNYLGPELQEAVFIPNPPKLKGVISSVTFRMAEYRHSQFFLRIRLMGRDPETGYPGEDLLFGENLVAPGRFRRHFTLQLTENAIPFPPDGVFVSFEWIPVNNNVSKNERTPYILGHLHADRSYVFSNYKELGWHLHTDRSELTGEHRVPGVSIIVQY